MKTKDQVLLLFQIDYLFYYSNMNFSDMVNSCYKIMGLFSILVMNVWLPSIRFFATFITWSHIFMTEQLEISAVA